MRHINIDEILLEFTAVLGCCCWFRFSQHPCLNMYVHPLEKSSCEALVFCAVRACFTNIILYLYIVACFLSVPMWACERSKHVCTIVYINAGLCMVCFQNLDVRCRYSFSMLGGMVSVDVICISHGYHMALCLWWCGKKRRQPSVRYRHFHCARFTLGMDAFLYFMWTNLCTFCLQLLFFHPLRNAF